MQTSDWLRQTTQTLHEAGIATARLDSLVLLEDATGKDRAWLLAHPEHELQGSILKILSTKIAQRAKHVPLAYIRGHAEFYGRDFLVNAHTLVPRPETETMIDMLKRVRNLETDVAVWEDGQRKKRSKRRTYKFEKPELHSSLVKTDEGYKVVWPKPTVQEPIAKPQRSVLNYHDEAFHLIDVGTGSGAIAITAKLEMPDAAVTAIDIDEKCIETAQANATSLGADVEFLRGNLLAPLQNTDEDKCQILLCNLPYVPDNFQINTAATHEPRHALFGGPDGLDLYREMFGQIKRSDSKPAYILTESLSPQHEVLAAVAATGGYGLLKTDDFIQLFVAV